MKKQKFKIPIYHADLTIIQIKNLRKLEPKYNLNSLHGFDACCFRNDKKNGYSRYVLAFDYSCTHSKIAHESLHLVGYIYKDRLMEMDINNDESQCYLLEWIIEKCLKVLKIKNT